MKTLSAAEAQALETMCAEFGCDVPMVFEDFTPTMSIYHLLTISHGRVTVHVRRCEPDASQNWDAFTWVEAFSFVGGNTLKSVKVV